MSGSSLCDHHPELSIISAIRAGNIVTIVVKSGSQYYRADMSPVFEPIDDGAELNTTLAVARSCQEKVLRTRTARRGHMEKSWSCELLLTGLLLEEGRTVPVLARHAWKHLEKEFVLDAASAEELFSWHKAFAKAWHKLADLPQDPIEH